MVVVNADKFALLHTCALASTSVCKTPSHTYTLTFASIKGRLWDASGCGLHTDSVTCITIITALYRTNQHIPKRSIGKACSDTKHWRNQTVARTQEKRSFARLIRNSCRTVRRRRSCWATVQIRTVHGMMTSTLPVVWICLPQHPSAV